MVIPQNQTFSHKFLRNYKATDTRTHTSIAGGSWCLKDKETIDKFHDEYLKDIEAGNHCYLTEVPGKISPVKVDLDMRWVSSDIKRLYDINSIKTIINVYYDVMSDIINYQDKAEYQAFIFEKPKPVENPKIENGCKDGIHIMFPFLNVDPVIERLIRDRVCEVFKNNKFFETLGYSNPVGDIIDSAVIDRNNWQMFGSRKPKCDKYSLTHILSKNEETGEMIELDVDTYTTRQLLNILSIRSRDDETMAPRTLIKREITKGLEPEYKKVLIRAKRRKLGKSKHRKRKSVKLDEKKLNFVVKAVSFLDTSRVSSYSDWLRMGLTLYHLHNADDTLLNSWISISKKVKGYEKEAANACKKYWTKDIPNGNWTSPPGMGSLKMWLKIDKPSEYTKLTSDVIGYWIKKACNTKGSSWDVAKVVHELYKHLFVCTSVKHKQWFHYIEEEHRWAEINDAIHLRKNLSTEVYNVFNQAAIYHGGKTTECGDYHDEERKKIINTMDQLKRTNFKQNVMKECIELFYDTKREFITKIDQNYKLLCFNNGVYDLSLGVLRNGRPEDMISFSTNIDYREYDEDDEEFMYYVNKLEFIINQIFPNEEVLDYVMLLLSSFLDGSTKNENFHIWTGSGANGKSLLIDLFQESLGEYSCVLPITLLTEKRAKSGVAQPELFATKGKRFAVLQEPGTKTTIQVGLLKELTGGDKIIARTLFKEPVEFKPQFKMVLTCNDLPKLPPNDGGTWRRVRATEFISKFKDDPLGHWENEYGDGVSEEQHQMNLENGGEFDDIWIPDSTVSPQYPIDRELKDEFQNPMYKTVFMSMLLRYYKRFAKEGLKEPAAVMEFTRKYRDEQDKVRQFIQDKIKTANECKKTEFVKALKMAQLYEAFQLWHSENYGGEKPTSKKALCKQFEEIFGKYSRNDKVGAHRRRGWYNIKLVSSKLEGDDSDDDDDDSDTFSKGSF